jgi:hypothetical protein
MQTALASDSRCAPYTLSSNPPNPKTAFRANDWMYGSLLAAECLRAYATYRYQLHIVHLWRSQLCVSVGWHRSRVDATLNGTLFGCRRNAACFNCRAPRARNGPITDMYTPSPRMPISPRFAAGPSSPAFGLPTAMEPSHMRSVASHMTQSPTHRPPPPPPPPASTCRVLTPSGRAFAQGGKVQNISSDPANVIFLFWPGNESFPQQCQMRPVLVTHSQASHSFHVAFCSDIDITCSCPQS